MWFVLESLPAIRIEALTEAGYMRIAERAAELDHHIRIAVEHLVQPLRQNGSNGLMGQNRGSCDV